MSAETGPGWSRRQAHAGGGTGLLAGGTPEQVHLTWGDDPTRSVVVSWCSPGQAAAPRVRIGQRIIAAERRGYADGPHGEITWNYHARVDGLRPGATYGYAVTADNDRYAADPFSATFSTAPAGRAAFRFTSSGDLSAPQPDAPRPGPARPPAPAVHAVSAVESFQPLFHLLNTDLACAGGDPDPASGARLRRNLGETIAASAAFRPWMPVPGHRGFGLACNLAGYTLAANGRPGVEGRWREFRVGSVAFVCLSADGHSGGARTRWLEATLAAARQDASVDWIVVGLHQCARSPGTGEDRGLGVGPDWLAIFDRYEVDLVLRGDEHGYERSFPVRGFEPGGGTGGSAQPHPVTITDSGVFDTSAGTVHLMLGGDARVPVPAQAGPRAATATVRSAPWSARRFIAPGYGIAAFDVSPGSGAGGQTSITVRYLHAGADSASPSGDYIARDTFTLVRPRADGRRRPAR